MDKAKLDTIALALGIKSTRTTRILLEEFLNGHSPITIEYLLSGHKETIELVKSEDSFKELLKKISPKRSTKKDKGCDGPEDMIRLSMWFIRKIGDPDKAVAAVTGAANALKGIA